MGRRPTKREREKFAILAGPVVDLHSAGKPINRAMNGAGMVIKRINAVPGMPDMPVPPKNAIKLKKL